MKRQHHSLLLALGLGAALLTLTAGAQDTPSPQDDSALTKRVEALERQLSEARTERDGLLSALEQNTQAIDRLERWAQAQADGAKDLAKTLDQSEQMGFTAGINFKSRETLLEGWRAALAEAQKDVPGGKVKKEAKVESGWTGR